MMRQRLSNRMRYHHRIAGWYFRLFPRQTLRREHQNAERKILLWLLGRLGDVVMASAVIGAIRTAHPDAWIGFATRWPYADVLRHDPRLDAVICCDTPDQIAGFTRKGEEPTCLHVIDPQNVDEFRSHVPDAESQAARGYWWTRGHVVELLAEATSERLGVEVSDLRSPIFIGDADDQVAKAYLQAQGITDQAKLVVFHTTTSVRLKDWPLAQFQGLADRLLAADPARHVLTVGSKGQLGLTGDRVVNAHGQLTVPQTAAAIARASAFVGLSSGPMHLADSLEVPSLVLFGSEYPGWAGPYQTRSVCIQSPTTCEPACCWPCDQPSFCIDDIRVDLAAEAFEELMAGRGQCGIRPDPS